MVRRLVTDRPVYGLAYGLAAQAPHRSADLPPRIEDLAAQYAEEMRSVQPRGPYTLVGYSGGGLVALEMAQQLSAQGETVGFLSLIDTYVHSRHGDFRRFPRCPLYRQIANLLRLPPVEIWLALNRKYQGWAHKSAAPVAELEDRWWAAYCPAPYSGDLTVFAAKSPWSVRRDTPSMVADWRQLTTAGSKSTRCRVGTIPSSSIRMCVFSLRSSAPASDAIEKKREAHRDRDR